MDSYYGTLLMRHEDGDAHFVYGSNSVLNSRALTSARWLKRLCSELPSSVSSKTYLLYLQFDDYSHCDLKSVAYGRKVGSDPIVSLIADTYFFESQGYLSTRNAARLRKLPAWNERRSMLAWRGSSTHDSRAPDGEFIRSPEQIPRIAVCRLLCSSAKADVGVVPWVVGQPEPSVVEKFIKAESLHKPMIPMIEFANYKLLLDIDGVANAWSLIDKLLMRSCILKVSSPYEQWFYHDLKPWIHYVPIREDLSDLSTQLDWCLSNDDHAEAIAEEGQKLAMAHSFEVVCELARNNINRSMLITS